MATSRAVLYTRFGGPEVLEIVERPDPEPGPAQVRVRVHAASVNPVDWKLRSGSMSPDEAPAAPAVPGFDVAGVVEAVGEGVTEPGPGTEVLGRAFAGAYAQTTLANAASLVAKPAALSWEVAASLPTPATTAYRALALLGLGGSDHAGTTLLVDGASGAVGVYVVQLARERGVTVLGTAGPARADTLRRLGAVALTYGPGLADRVREAAPQGVDLALDVAGRTPLAEIAAITGSVDRVLSLGDPDAASKGVRFTHGGDEHEVPGALAAAAARVVAGELEVPPVTTYRLEDAGKAQTDNETGAVAGKLVVRP